MSTVSDTPITKADQIVQAIHAEPTVSEVDAHLGSLTRLLSRYEKGLHAAFEHAREQEARIVDLVKLHYDKDAQIRELNAAKDSLLAEATSLRSQLFPEPDAGDQTKN